MIASLYDKIFQQSITVFSRLLDLVSGTLCWRIYQHPSHLRCFISTWKPGSSENHTWTCCSCCCNSVPTPTLLFSSRIVKVEEVTLDDAGDDTLRVREKAGYGVVCSRCAGRTVV